MDIVITARARKTYEPNTQQNNRVRPFMRDRRLMMEVTMEFARRDDCLEQMVPSDLRQLVGQIDQLQRQNDELVAKLSRIEQASLVTRSDNCAEDVIDRIHLALAEPESRSLQNIQDEAALEMANYLYKNGYTLNTAVEAAEERLAELRQQSTNNEGDGDE